MRSCQETRDLKKKNDAQHLFSTNFLNFQVVPQEKKSLSTYKQMWGMYLDLEATAHFLLYFKKLGHNTDKLRKSDTLTSFSVISDTSSSSLNTRMSKSSDPTKSY